jgi:hypothetical protein
LISFATQKLNSLHIFCLKNKAFASKAIPTLVALNCLILAPAFKSQAQEEFKSDQIELSIPNNFERVENKAAILLLRNKTEGFPTFNAVLVAGIWPYLNLSVVQQAQKIEDSYHLIGLKNAKVINSSVVEIDGIASLKTELTYEINNIKYRSEVWLLTLSDRHLVLTAVFKSPAKQEEIDLIRNLVQAIKIKGTKESEVVSKSALVTGNQFLVLGSFTLGLFALFLTWLFLRRKSQSKS